MVDDRAIQVVQGEEPVLDFTLMNVDILTGTLVPYDITLKDIRFVVRRNNTDLASYLSTGVDPPITRVPATPNSIRIQIGTDATSLVSESDGDMRYFLTLLTAGRAQTVRMGNWIVVDY